jgi:hypothetical protein
LAESNLGSWLCQVTDYRCFVNFTKQARTIGAGERCARCRRALPERAATGRPRRYCRESCRQMDYQARRRRRELQLGDDELIVTRRQLDQLRDDVYVLACAVQDVERDLTARPTSREVRTALDWLLDAARPLCHHDL